METVFSLKSSIWFCIGNENRRIRLGPFLDRDSDDDNDDNDDDSDDSDENFEEWMNNSGNTNDCLRQADEVNDKIDDMRIFV